MVHSHTHTHTGMHIHQTYVQKWWRSLSPMLACITAVMTAVYVNYTRRSPEGFQSPSELYASGSTHYSRTELTNSENPEHCRYKENQDDRIDTQRSQTSLLICWWKSALLKLHIWGPGSSNLIPMGPLASVSSHSPTLSPQLPHYQINLSCCSVSDVICAELQMLKDPWGCVV